MKSLFPIQESFGFNSELRLEGRGLELQSDLRVARSQSIPFRHEGMSAVFSFLLHANSRIDPRKRQISKNRLFQLGAIFRREAEPWTIRMQFLAKNAGPQQS